MTKNVTSIDALSEIQARVVNATLGLPAGSSAQVWKARETIEQAYRDGLLTAAPEWHGPRRVVLRLPGESMPIETQIYCSPEEVTNA